MAIKGRQQAVAAGQMTKQFIIHSNVLKDVTFNKHAERTYTAGKVSRTVSIRDSGGFKMVDEMDEKISRTGVIFYPESLEYIFEVEGIAKKLLMFIAFHLLNPRKNTFLFNPQTLAAFNNYSAITTNKTYKSSTVQQLLRKELVERNIVVNVSTGQYMLNPMIGGCNTFAIRRTLIAEYSDLLIKKGKNTFADFYPKYSK